MKTPLQRIRAGLSWAALILIIAYCGYIWFGYSWSEALWMLAITISTVGYGEHPERGPAFQLFTVGVIVFGMTAVAYTFGGLVQMVVEGELARSVGKRRQLDKLRQLKNHVIVCGFGRIGQTISGDLAKQDRSFVIIEQDEKLAEEANEHQLLCVQGDATQDELLILAGVERAHAIVSALSSDAANVFITLTAREMNPQIFIVARAENLSTERKLRAAGANRVVMPARIGAHIMERLITRPNTADFLELVAESSFGDVEMDEIDVPQRSPITDKQLAEVTMFREHRLLVVGVKQVDGEMTFNPPTHHVFAEGQVLIVMGHSQDIRRFRERLGVVYDIPEIPTPESSAREDSTQENSDRENS